MSNSNRVREINRGKTFNRADILKAEDDAISALHSWTDVFDVAPLVPHVEAVWATAIQNKGVVVVAQNASVASCSAISILSMLEPMKYAEPCMIFTQVGDPSFTIENLILLKSWYQMDIKSIIINHFRIKNLDLLRKKINYKNYIPVILLFK